MHPQYAYEVAKDIQYNLDVRPQPVRVLVIAPAQLAYEIERHFRSLIRPDMHLVDDNGVRFSFREGGRVAIIARRHIKDASLFTEGSKVL